MKLYRERYERIALAVAALLLLVSVGWSWRQHGMITALRQEPTGLRFSGADYVASVLPPSERELPEWTSPPSQSRGAEWRYEVFTPPAVCYHAASRQYAVDVPGSGNITSGAPGTVDIQPQPRRVQLIGYLGAPGSFVGIFSGAEHAEELLARAGGRLPSLELTVKAIEPAKILSTDAEGRLVEDLTVRAIVRDERTGEEVVLTPGGAASAVGRAPSNSPSLATEQAERVVATEPAR